MEIVHIRVTNYAPIIATMVVIGSAVEVANQIALKDVKDNRNTYHITIAVVIHATELAKVVKAAAIPLVVAVAMGAHTKPIIRDPQEPSRYSNKCNQL